MAKEKLVYLAGPFFNPAQVELMEQLEQYLNALGVSYFSPRLHTQAPTGADRQKLGAWDEVLKSNIDALEEADLVLAVLDYKLPNHQALVLNEFGSTYDENHGNLMIKSTPLSLPDTGTVWELGFAFAESKPTVGFFERKPERMNLMLTNTLDALLIGVDRFVQFFTPPLRSPWQQLLNRLLPNLGCWSWDATTSLEDFLAGGGRVI